MTAGQARRGQASQWWGSNASNQPSDHLNSPGFHNSTWPSPAARVAAAAAAVNACDNSLDDNSLEKHDLAPRPFVTLSTVK